MTLSHWIVSKMRRVGVDIRRFEPGVSEAARLKKLFDTYQVDLVIDVGANIGNYGIALRDCGYNGRIISFEPIQGAYDKLVENAKSDAYWSVAPRMALGERDGTIQINVAGNVDSSSILAILPAHLNAAPEARYIATENVPIRTLDGLCGTVLPTDAKSVFVKLDVQGYEKNVLVGGKKFFSTATGVQLELSLVPLYEGQILYDKMIEFLRIEGFVLTAGGARFYRCQFRTDAAIRRDLF
jgi:FkbM family methyltransferase